MKQFWSKYSLFTAVFVILLCAYCLVFSGFCSSDDEQLFSTLSTSMAFGHGYSALPLFGNDRLRGESGGVEPLHALLGIPLVLIADRFDLGKVQILFLLPAIYTALTGAFLVSIAEKKGYPPNTSVLLGLAYGLGTIAFPYARTNFREPLAALFITATVFYIEKNVHAQSENWKTLFQLIIGFIFLILAVFTKITTVILAPFLAYLFISKKHFPGWKNKPSAYTIVFIFIALIIIIGAMIPFLMPTESISRFTFRFFDYIRTSLPQLPHDHFWPAVAGLFVSPGKGLLVYSPILLLAFISPFLNQKNDSDWTMYMGAVFSLASVQALIYDNQWWSITWGTRALIPALPLACLAALPAFHAGFNKNNSFLRAATGLLLVISSGVQVGRLLTSDPVFANWVVGYTGQSIKSTMQWSIRLAPLIRHWNLAVSNQASDLAWLYTRWELPVLCFISLSLLVMLASIHFLVKPGEKYLLFPAGIFFLLLVVLILTPICARFDRRYNGDVVTFREITAQIYDLAQMEDLVLIDSYLNPFWWNYSNFNLSKAAWVGLPYLHQTAINSEFFFPRISETSKMVQHALLEKKRVFLVQLPQESLPTYSEAFEKDDFFVKLIQTFPNPNMQIFELR